MACPSLPCTKSCASRKSLPCPMRLTIWKVSSTCAARSFPSWTCASASETSRPLVKKNNRILVVEHAGRLAGLIVDSASEVLKIPADAVEAPPAVFQEGGLNCVTGLGKVAGTAGRAARYEQATCTREPRKLRSSRGKEGSSQVRSRQKSVVKWSVAVIADFESAEAVKR